MKVKHLFIGFLGAFALTACSSEEPNVNGGSENQETRSDAYIVVNIVDNGSTRAEDGDANDATKDPEYKYGVANENEVTDAQFFFFDASGIYVGKHRRWDGANAGTTENVELIGKNIILLENTEKTGYPKYLLTVLNEPDFDIPQGTNLVNASKTLRNWMYTKSGETTGHFVMSTSSFYGTPNNDSKHYNDTYYYVTVLDESDFIKYNPATETPSIDVDGKTASAVDIYVERLAAKVQLAFGEDKDKQYVEKTDEGYYIFKTEAAVMGYDNEGEEGTQIANTTLYVKVSGWDLSATAPQSYLSKQLLEGWKETGPWTNWQNINYYRSFWAQSTVYDNVNPTLDYKYYSELTVPVVNTNNDDKKVDTNVAYCNENTNTYSNIVNSEGLPYANKITHALLKTQLCIKDGESYKPINAVKYNGLLFTYDRYKDYLLDKINQGNGSLNMWMLTSENVTAENATVKDFKQIDNTYVKFELASKVQSDDNLKSVFSNYKNGTGLILAVANIPSDAILYTKYVDEADNKEKFKKIESPESVLNNYLKAAQDQSAEAFGGDGNDAGAMYYTIPIEHEVSNTKAEGYYGVVRNHWYQLTVDNIVRVGHGVFNPGDGSETDPGEPIIPNDPEDPRYYVSARVNILSWKLVKPQHIIL